MQNNYKFQPTKVADVVSKKMFIERLPEWMQNVEQIQKFSDDIIQQFFNPVEEEVIDGYIGDIGSPAAAGKIFLKERTTTRQMYQLSPAYVSRNADNSVNTVQFYEDLTNYLKTYGALTENQDRLYSSNFYAWTPPINPNKIQNFGSYVWDLNNEFNIAPDYVVMERGSIDGNTWSLQNYWYTLGQKLPNGVVLTESMLQDPRWARAQAPIIEFNKNIELMNHGSKFRGVVTYLSDSLKPEDIVQRSVSDNIKVDGFILQQDDTILFTSIGNSGENNRIYKVQINQMPDGSRVYGLILDPDEVNSSRPTGEPHTGDVILIKSGNVYRNVSVYWNGSDWIRSQAKNGTNVFPQFQLYDKNSIKLNDPVVYPSSTFNGSELFGLKINFNYSLDKIYNAHVELSEYNYYVFENFLQSVRYNYDRLGVETEIPGLYFYSVRTETGDFELKTDWVRNTEKSKQYVKQVPEMTKVSMYKVFNTLHDRDVFNNALDGMDCYVLETDRYYKYIKDEITGIYSWVQQVQEGIPNDVFNKEFELAQKINPNNTNDLIEVTVNGEITNKFQFINNIDGNADKIVLDSSVKIDENSVVQIRTYSSSVTPNLELGAYEIPMNLQYNPYNENVLYVDQSTYTLHFYDIIKANITSGSESGINDYENVLESGNADNSTGRHIIQNESPMMALMLFTANKNIDMFESIMFNQNEYFRFKNRFNNVMLDMYRADPDFFNTTSASDIVNIVLNKINAGKNDSFPFAIDNVGSSAALQKTYIPCTPQFLGILKAHVPEKRTYLYAGRDMIQYNIDHTGLISKSYKAINGAAVLDDVIFELENRIYNSIDIMFKDVDYQPILDEVQLNPSMMFTDTTYNTDEYNKILLRGYINFIATNGISNETHEYDPNDWMTWNFKGSTYNSPSQEIASGSWRAVYTKAYGTYRPHTHPWEMFGFGKRPEWFNQEYEPTKVIVGYELEDFVYVYTTYVKNEQGQDVPTGLWDSTSGLGDASTGTILFGAHAGQHPEYVRFGKAPFTITETQNLNINGEPICTIDLISPDVLGIVSTVLEHKAEPWSYGDMGEMEFTYMNTALYAFDKAAALYRAKPTEFISYFLDTKGSTLQKVQNSTEKQFLYGNTRNRLNFNSSTTVHTENGTRVLGNQTWVSDYLIFQNKNVTSNFGNVLRSSYVNVGYKLAGFSKADQLTFKSDAFGLISQENQHIGLVKSIVRSEETLSAMKILWNGQGYVVSGYDLIGAEFNTQVPNKIGRRNTIKIGQQNFTHYNDYKESTTSTEYGSLFKNTQELYSFICAYGERLERSGWIFEDSTEAGVLNNWNTLAREFVEWSQTKLNVGDFISISPSSVTAKFGSTFGSVESVTQFSGGVWSLMDDQNNGIRQFEINTARIGNVFTVRLNDDVEKRMGLIRLHLSSYEHSVVFDDNTIFGDKIYYPLFGSVFEMLKVYGYRTANWNGRFEASGFIILETGTLPNFEKIVTDFKNYYDTDAIMDNNTIQDLSRHLIGFQTREYISQMITSEPSQVDFYKGFIKEKGTNAAFEKVLRVSKTYNTENYKALQEWAFKVGTYGNVYGKKHLQFKLNDSELVQEPQLFIFDEEGVQYPELPYIQYYGTQGEDLRWITRPKDSETFPMREGRSSNINLPDIGPVTLNEVSYSTLSFETAYIDRLRYIQETESTPTSVWMLRNNNDIWDIYELHDTGVKLVSITPLDDSTDPSDQHCELLLDADHGLVDGDYFYFVDSSEYMPDLLKQERQYFSSGSNNKIVIPLNLLNTITFSSGEMPSLFLYKERFTEVQKSEYVQQKYSFKAPETKFFARPSTYNSSNNITEMYLNVFDPINGIIPGIIMSNIDFVDSYDPAKYNSYETNTQAWGSERVGEVWWDTSKAFFMDYTRPILDSSGNVDNVSTLEYKRTHWGKLLPSASIDVYEWVASPVQPFNWNDYCTKQSKLNKGSSWVPSGEALNENYSEFQEYDRNTNSYSTVYYFWVKNTIYLPNVLSRTKSCYEIARTIQDPLLLNTPWFSAIDDKSFIISGIEREITDDKSILTIEYTLDETEVIKHEQFQLCREGEEYNFNPFIWESMWNSLKSYEKLPNSTQNELHYPTNDLGILPNQIWFKDVLEARREYVRSTNDVFRTKNIITNSVVMNEIFNVKTEEVNPNEVQIKVLTYNNEFVIVPNEDKFVENDTVLVSSTGTLPEPLNSASVYFVHFDDNGYIHLMNSPSSAGNAVTITLSSRGEGTLSMIKQSDYIESLGTSLDMTTYWELADWYDVGYNENTPYTSEKSLAIADTKNYQEDSVIRVVDSTGLWTLYTLRYSRQIPLWTAVGRQNSTIALNSKIYDGYVQYNDDGTPTNTEINVRKALDLLQGAYESFQSSLVFDLVKYVHVEQGVVDWVFKTSYIYILGLDQTLQKSYIQNDNFINQIVSYFEEVKPYRTKIRSQIEQKTSDEDEINGIVNDLDPNGYIFVDGKWIKSQKDIWDYQYAKYNDSTKKWEEVGTLPSDFVTPNRRFQEINTIMVYDNVQCQPNITYSEEELSAIPARYSSQTKDLLTPNTMYKLQQFQFSTPALDMKSINQRILQDLYNTYPSIDPLGDPVQEIDKLYVEFVDDIESTNKLTSDIKVSSDTVYESDEGWNWTSKYTQYYTLANRLSLSGKTPEQIEVDVNCPFKGTTLSDNTNTRLPVGFSPSNDFNFGYSLESVDTYNKMYNVVKQSSPSSTDAEIKYILAYEYGLYSFKDDMNSLGRNYTDAVRVLTVMRNVFDKDNSDPYVKAKQILGLDDSVDDYAFVMIPRKHVRVRDVNTQEIHEVPFSDSIEDYMENSFIVNGAVLEMLYINLDDVKLDVNNPIFNEVQGVISAIREAGYFDDINAFDSSGLESQYTEIQRTVKGIADSTKDSCFMDMSELNPLGEEFSSIKVSISGYSYDTPGNAQLKDQGRFQIDGLAIQNPYNRKEAIISIPRYDSAIEHMNKSLVQRTEIKYFESVTDIVSTNGELILNEGHDIRVGDDVMVFVPEEKNLEVQNFDGTWKTLLDVNNIKTSNRPTLFKIVAVNDRNVQVQGLVLSGTYSSNDDTYMNPDMKLPLTVVRISTFGSSEFTTSQALYSDVRTYVISMLKYDNFWDRYLVGGKLSTTSYDVIYSTNETEINVDGVFVDHGFNSPIYGAGVLSELVRNRMTDSIQIYVYEYVNSTINPVFNGTEWTYTGNVVDGMFINDKPARSSVLIVDSQNASVTNLAAPTAVDDYTITQGAIQSPNSNDGDYVVIDADISELRNSKKMNQGQFGSCTQYYIPGSTYTGVALVLGNKDNIEVFMSGEAPIPSTRFYNGKVLSGTLIQKMIQ